MAMVEMTIQTTWISRSVIHRHWKRKVLIKEKKWCGNVDSTDLKWFRKKPACMQPTMDYCTGTLSGIQWSKRMKQSGDMETINPVLMISCSHFIVNANDGVDRVIPYELCMYCFLILGFNIIGPGDTSVILVKQKYLVQIWGRAFLEEEQSSLLHYRRTRTDSSENPQTPSAVMKKSLSTPWVLRSACFLLFYLDMCLPLWTLLTPSEEKKKNQQNGFWITPWLCLWHGLINKWCKMSHY